MLSRRAFVLAELVVALTIAGITMAIVTSIAVRQQRAFADLADQAALGAQIQDARAIVPIDVRDASPTLGDIRDARDTAVDFRATIASGVLTDTAPGTIILALATSGAGTLLGIAQPIEANDTVWVLAPNDSGEDWRPFRVTSVSSGGARTSLTVGTVPSPAVGMPIRVTRPERYSLYRASDNAWYLGLRDWNNTTLRFNTIQPVAGPFLAPSQGGVRFTYLDSTGAPMPTPVADRARITAIRLDIRGHTRNPPRTLGNGFDSAGSVVMLRNRR
jgi:hypothetical protein